MRLQPEKGGLVKYVLFRCSTGQRNLKSEFIGLTILKRSMRHMTIKKMMLGLALVAMATAGFAATITVGPSETYTTIAAGVAAASATDTVVVKEGTYAEACPINITVAGLTIMADTDAAVTITQTAGTKDQKMITVNGADFTLQGASTAKKLLLQNAATGASNVTLDLTGGGTPLVENVKIAGPGGGTAHVYTTSAATLNNVDIVVSSGNGFMPASSANGNTVLNDCVIDCTGIPCYGNGVALPNKVMFNRLTLKTTPYAIHSSSGGEVVLTDCLFQSTRPVGGSGAGGPGNETVTLIKPTRTGVSGLGSGGKNSVVNIMGKSPADKAILPQIGTAFDGGAIRNLYSCDQTTDGLGSVLNMTDVICTGTLETGDGETNNHVVFNLNRVWINGPKTAPAPGQYVYHPRGPNWEGTGRFDFNATNCMLAGGQQGGTSDSDWCSIECTRGNNGGNNLNLTHCTIWCQKYGPAHNKRLTWFTSIGAIAHPGTADTHVANYCAYAGGYKLYSSWFAATGGHNVVQSCDPYGIWPGASATAGLPTMTNSVVGAPNIDPETGMLTLSSDLCDRKAVGSTMTIDFFGKARPRLGTVPDIGAEEGFVVPAELSTFQVE